MIKKERGFLIMESGRFVLEKGVKTENGTRQFVPIPGQQHPTAPGAHAAQQRLKQAEPGALIVVVYHPPPEMQVLGFKPEEWKERED